MERWIIKVEQTHLSLEGGITRDVSMRGRDHKSREWSAHGWVLFLLELTLDGSSTNMLTGLGCVFGVAGREGNSIRSGPGFNWRRS